MNLEQLKQEVTFKTSRSSGPGGQNVNKVETKVELRFDVPNSRFLEEPEKQLVLTNLASRITNDGILLIISQATRSQLENKEAAWEEFCRLMEQAAEPPKKRKKVKPLTANREERLSKKKQVSEKKSARQKVTLRQESDLCFFSKTREPSTPHLVNLTKIFSNEPNR